ncbi:16120_t:CDS:10 [Acaulospora morrowiae]|uniref:Importin-95 n=1 Tax=Acaulospora morrowiae TaxID=94023 RepID=A0A9N9GE87_9GLOM|nr:16120_t:CDS:10 [Acaulospora morrowiae]
MLSIGELLANTLSGGRLFPFSNLYHVVNFSDQQLREDASRQLEQAQQSNYPVYVSMLCTELHNEQAASYIRNSAGLALKNSLISSEASRRNEITQRWLNMDEETRQQIKQMVLTTLGSSDQRAAATAAQVVSAISAIELPAGQWTDLMKNLLENVTTTDNSQLKISTLMAIGFVCESIDSEILAAQSGAILTAVVSGARKEEPNQEVRKAAIDALYNSLEFIRENFDREGERNYIMQVVCEATQSSDVNVQVAAFECLVRIMQIYYDKMRFYMEKALFGLTVLGMKHEDERVALQAVEFWSTVCDEELELMSEAAEAQETGEQPDRLSHNFAKAALPEILPVLLWLLTKQDEEADEDDWNVSMAAGTCLALLAQCVEDAVVAPVIPFVENHIRHNDWRFREAAVMAFGSILEGPEHKLLAGLVNQALPVLIEMMRDPSPQVKDTTAWTLGRVSELLIECIKPDVHLRPLITALVYGLKDSPRIVSNCCWALMSLSDQFGSKEISQSAYHLSPYFEGIITALLETTERSTNESNSRTSSYECISILVQGAALDCFPTIQKLTVTILDRLEATIQAQNQIVGSDERLAHSELQSNLCSVLTSIIRKLRTEVSPFADRIMTVLLSLFTTATKHSTTLEDGFLAVGAVTTAMEADFVRYLEAFAPFLYAALSNHEEYQLCSIAVGLIGDICRALQEQSLPYCDTFMNVLLQNLQSPVLNRSVKPAILSCFGDIALAISGRFEVYLEVVMMVLAQASNMRATDGTNYDMIDYVIALREGILEAYVGIVQGLKTGEKADLLLRYIEQIFSFLNMTWNDHEKTEIIIRSMIGLIGDLAEAFPNGQIKQWFQYDCVTQVLKEGRNNRSLPNGTREVTRWAREVCSTIYILFISVIIALTLYHYLDGQASNPVRSHYSNIVNIAPPLTSYHHGSESLQNIRVDSIMAILHDGSG